MGLLDYYDAWIITANEICCRPKSELIKRKIRTAEFVAQLPYYLFSIKKKLTQKKLSYVARVIYPVGFSFDPPFLPRYQYKFNFDLYQNISNPDNNSKKNLNLKTKATKKKVFLILCSSKPCLN